ncbi:MAG TPA: hypothetical protein VF473_07495 [Cyclobacteriaceae bacterium]
MVRFIMVVCSGLCVVSAFAQDLQFESLNKLPVSINTNCDEIMPLGSVDGRTLYFARVACSSNDGGVEGGSDIWISEYNKQSKEWGRPKNAGSVLNDRGNNAIVGMSADGKSVYLVKTSPGRRIKGVYVSKKITGGKWSPPELEAIPFLETQEYFGIYVAPDLKTVVASMKRDDGTGEEDLYVSRKSAGAWSQPQNLGTIINTIGFEISPFLSADGKRLFFSSNGHRGLGGADIFYSDRLDDTWTKWSEPVNLGDKINTEGFDAYFSMSDSVIWFTSSNGSNSDIYRAKIKGKEKEENLAVNNIVEEATSMIADLTDDTYDSLSTVTQSVFVNFEKGTALLSTEAVKRLDETAAMIRNRKQGKLKLIAYVNAYNGEKNQLWDKRLEEIRDYLRKKSGVDLLIDYELIPAEANQSASRASVVEVRYN